jgi:hypothetical protein
MVDGGLCVVQCIWTIVIHYPQFTIHDRTPRAGACKIMTFENATFFDNFRTRVGDFSERHDHRRAGDF